MTNQLDPKADPGQPTVYQIRVRGHLGSQWSDWFGGLTISLEENGDTLLTGRVVDQAALYCLLRHIRDLGMPLVSINIVEPGQHNASMSNQVQFNEGHPNPSSEAENEYKP